MVCRITFIEKNTFMDKFRKIIKDSGILADVKTTSEGAGLMSVLFKEVIEMLLLAE
ncbi:MAG: hypothetical protein OXC03_00495 [Flavobacteriaceae bacterium]|nr:hypothetical protein [Flavobacteriaceae bacterium]